MIPFNIWSLEYGLTCGGWLALIFITANYVTYDRSPLWQRLLIWWLMVFSISLAGHVETATAVFLIVAGPATVRFARRLYSEPQPLKRSVSSAIILALFLIGSAITLNGVRYREIEPQYFEWTAVLFAVDFIGGAILLPGTRWLVLTPRKYIRRLLVGLGLLFVYFHVMGTLVFLTRMQYPIAPSAGMITFFMPPVLVPIWLRMSAPSRPRVAFTVVLLLFTVLWCDYALIRLDMRNRAARFEEFSGKTESSISGFMAEDRLLHELEPWLREVRSTRNRLNETRFTANRLRLFERSCRLMRQGHHLAAKLPVAELPRIAEAVADFDKVSAFPDVESLRGNRLVDRYVLDRTDMAPFMPLNRRREWSSTKKDHAKRIVELQSYVRLIHAVILLRTHLTGDGSLIDDLANLPADVSRRWPVDPLGNGKPMRLIRFKEGVCVYSVGTNGVDEKGMPGGSYGPDFFPSTGLPHDWSLLIAEKSARPGVESFYDVWGKMDPAYLRAKARLKRIKKQREEQNGQPGNPGN